MRIGSIQRWPEALSALTAPGMQTAAADYLAALDKRDTSGALRRVDKAPLNFHHAGLIALMFPRATIIWCRRDPRDICVSIYGENFALEQPFATDPGDLGFFCREYMRLTRHWQAVLGDRLHEGVYEELVAQPEAGARALIDATGLPRDDACLNFHQSDRAALTPSRWQVRQPIYSKGRRSLASLRALVGAADRGARERSAVVTGHGSPMPGIPERRIRCVLPQSQLGIWQMRSKSPSTGTSAVSVSRSTSVR